MRFIFTLLTIAFTYASSFGQAAAGRPGNNGGVSFTYTTRPDCKGDAVVLSNTSTPAAGVHDFSWDFGDGSATDNLHASLTHIYAKAGKYTVTLTYVDGSNPDQKYTYSMPVVTSHPLDARIAVPETSVCWLVPISFSVASESALSASYSWDFGDGAKATDNEIDYTYPNPGEYSVQLMVTDKSGCTVTDKARVSVVKITAYTATHDTAVCLKDPLVMTAYAVVEPASVPYKLEWTPAEHINNANSASTSFLGVGDFIYTVTASTSYPACNATDTEAIHSYPTVTLTNITPSQTIPQGTMLQLGAEGATYYVWSPANGTVDNPNISSPLVSPVDSVTKYTVYGMNDYGCLDSASVVITTVGNSEVVPTAFTPNNDGLNDVFRLSNVPFQKLVDFKVFNRWGKLMYKTSNPERGWDGTLNGTPQETGVYTYQIILIQVDGTSKTYKGNVTLLR